MRKRHVVLGFLGTISAITFLDRMAIAVAGPQVQSELHIGPEVWGWILSAYVVANGIFEIPSGALGDRFGHRWEFIRIVAWWSAFTAVTAWCRTTLQLAGARFLFGLGSAGAYPNAAGVLYRWLPLKERARGQGVVWAASRLGGALAPLLLLPLQAQLGWRAVFLILGGVGFCWALAWAVWFRDEPAAQPGITAQELDEIGPAAGARLHGKTPWGPLLRLPQLWLIVVAYGCYAWASWFYFGWFPTWLVKAGHFNPGQVSIFASLPFFLGIATNLVGGWLSDRLAQRIGAALAYRLITGVCLAVTAVLLLAMSLVTSPALIVALAAISFGCMDLMLPSAWAMCMSVGRRWGGVATGVMNTAGQAGGLFCTLFFGYAVKETGDYNLPVRAIAVAVLIAAVLFALVDASKGYVETEGAPA